MPLLSGTTEIGFPTHPSGGVARAMWDIGKRRRRRGWVGKPTTGGFAIPLDVVSSRFRWPRIAVRELPSQRASEAVSVVPYNKGML